MENYMVTKCHEVLVGQRLDWSDRGDWQYRTIGQGRDAAMLGVQIFADEKDAMQVAASNGGIAIIVF